MRAACGWWSSASSSGARPWHSRVHHARGGGGHGSAWRRATAYGLFSVAIGVGGLVGGVVAGALYDVSVFALMVYAVVVEAIAFALLWKTVRR